MATGAFADVTIEGDSVTHQAPVGDTLSIKSRKLISVGDNFVRWDIVSGTGLFTDATRDSTGFVPTSKDVTLKIVTRSQPTFDLTETKKTYNFYRNSVRIPYSSMYGIKMRYKISEPGQYAMVYKSEQTLTVAYFGADSTFTKTVTRDCRSSTGRNVKCVFNADTINEAYLCSSLSYYPFHNMKDSAQFWMTKTHRLEVSHTGNGMAYVDSSGYASPANDRVIDIDSIKIYAAVDSNNIFDHWEVSEGTCGIVNPKKDTTKVYGVTSDCKVHAVFIPGRVYTITDTPTRYTFAENEYAKRISKSNGHMGVRFTFTAPSNGTYSIITSNEFTNDSIFYLRYTDSTRASLSVSAKFKGSYTNTLNLTAGQTIYVVVFRTNKKENPFYISYATQPYSLRLSSDSTGKTRPDTGYAKAYLGTKYSIGAEADSGYRFSNWQTVSGTPSIDDLKSPFTFVTISDSSEVKAVFKKSEIYKLTKAKREFNFQQHYYTESSRSAIRFTWTPPDNATYNLRFEPVDPIAGIIKEYSTDSTFKNVFATSAAKGVTSITFSGAQGKPLYWTFQDSTTGIPNKSFKVWISSPYVLTVESSKGGLANPAGKLFTSPGDTTIINAWPNGGYKFSSWDIIEGNVNLSTQTGSRTKVTPIDSICSIKANFKEDESAEPSLKIANLDLGNYPEICAQVAVTDAQNGHAFFGLEADDFVLTEDGRSIHPQVTSIEAVAGISVVIVVDESSSMTSNKRMTKAKEAIKDFIYNMGPYDRTAIVGFKGKIKVVRDTVAKDTVVVDSTVIRQTMTSDQSLLLQAVDSIKADASQTNIVTGTLVGIQQIVNETNATAVIVFSDGENNSGTKDVRGTVDLAKHKKTTVYSIALESEARYPLEDLAVGTGGTFSIASDASELAGLYASIRSNILSQYVVCYQTPDVVQDGETHHVAISTTFNGKTTSDTAQWNERAIPPTITLTEDTWDLVENRQAEGIPLTIGVYIRSEIGISYANLFVRRSGSMEIFASYPMQNVSDSLWEFTIPASLVAKPGLDFYVTAVDFSGQTGKSPKIQTPAREPYTIFIDNDIPVIEQISVACEDSTKDTKTFVFKISDSDGIQKASLYFRDSRSVIFQETPLAHSDIDDTWATDIAASTNFFTGIDYYIRVTDSWGATVRYIKDGFTTTEACEIKIPVIDTIPEDSTEYTNRDSIEYSLIADSAEIYDKNLDGMADFVRIHFKDETNGKVKSIDSVFWNSNRGEWRYAPRASIKANKDDAKWVEASVNAPFKYGQTSANASRMPFLSFTTAGSDQMEYVKLSDRVGAVPLKAIKHHGEVNLEKYMDPSSEPPMDTLIVVMSEPIVNTGADDAWESLFRFSKSCGDTVSQPLKIKNAPQISDNGLQWVIPLEDHTLKAGYCLQTNPEATYKDDAGNSMGRGGVAVEGMDGSIYLTEVKPLQSVSGLGNVPEWIPPGASAWEDLPDSLTAISVKTMLPYTADVYIFDAISVYATHFEQKFGYDGEMDHAERDDAKDHSKLGFLYWDQRAKNGRKVGTGVYIWKIFFTFDDGHKETIVVKTGIKR